MESTTTGARKRTAARKPKRKPAAAPKIVRSTRETTEMEREMEREAARARALLENAEPLKSPAVREFGAGLSGLITGGPHETRITGRGATGVNVGEASDGGNHVMSRGLELEEISTLLMQRESRGYQQGHSAGWMEGRRGLGLRIQRERNESVAGTLLFVVRQLSGVVERLAEDGPRDVVADRAARLEFVEMLAEMSRQAQRIADGEDELSAAEGTGL